MSDHQFHNPIGIFDSGIGGLSVLQAILIELPAEGLIYFADQANVPYGEKSLTQVRALSVEITKFLLRQNVKLIVVACNTASAAALHHLRKRFPQIPFVGMEPAIKPAAEHTQSKIVGVLATPATFQGRLYASLIERFGENIEILQDTCPGLVAEIEAGIPDTTAVRSILENALLRMIEQNVDTIVLGCTHYPFVLPTIHDIVGDNIRVIDPAPAVARQTRRLSLQDGSVNNNLKAIMKKTNNKNNIRFFTSGDVNHFQGLVQNLFGENIIVTGVGWSELGEVYTAS